MFANNLFQAIYDNLEDACQAGEQFIKDTTQAVSDAASATVQWIWEALQGDFNEDMTVGQIVGNTVLGLIPIVDQVLDCRDVIANCKHIEEDPDNTEAWIALCLTLVGIIPLFGSAVKGVLKILFLFLRRGGSDIAQLLKPAFSVAKMFLNNPKVQKVLGNKSASSVYLEVAAKLKEVAASINTQQLMGVFKDVIDAYKSVAETIGKLAPESVRIWLNSSYQSLQRIYDIAEEKIDAVVGMVEDILNKTHDEIIRHADDIPDGHKAIPNTKIRHIDDLIDNTDAQIVKGSKKNGVFGEVASDIYMENKNFEPLLDTIPRDLYAQPHGRGIDGVYKNPKHPNPPPPYVITETKFRTNSENAIRKTDGLAKNSLLDATDGSNGFPAAKQMSDDWIEPRLYKQLGKARADGIIDEEYERWLMIVDDNGEVINITKLDEFGNNIEEVPL